MARLGPKEEAVLKNVYESFGQSSLAEDHKRMSHDEIVAHRVNVMMPLNQQGFIKLIGDSSDGHLVTRKGMAYTEHYGIVAPEIVKIMTTVLALCERRRNAYANAYNAAMSGRDREALQNFAAQDVNQVGAIAAQLGVERSLINIIEGNFRLAGVVVIG